MRASRGSVPARSCNAQTCPVPPPTGACCDTATGACTITTQAACAFTWLGAGRSCNTETCPVPPPTGACCDTATGACTITTQAACALHVARRRHGVQRADLPGAASDRCLLRHRHGCLHDHDPGRLCVHVARCRHGVQCTETCPVPPPTGACCDTATGACTITTQAACAFTWLGAGRCAVHRPARCRLRPVPAATPRRVPARSRPRPRAVHVAWRRTCVQCTTCPVPAPTGACCDFATGACTITTQAACAFTWLGAGTVCSARDLPGACPDGCLLQLRDRRLHDHDPGRVRLHVAWRR